MATRSRCCDWLPEGSLERLDILYPDPWPKRRHWKRRFISDDRVKRIARAVAKGGTVRFASDIPHYAEWALIRFLRSGAFRWTAESRRRLAQALAGFPGTRYEAKAMREGRKRRLFNALCESDARAAARPCFCQKPRYIRCITNISARSRTGW